MNSNHDPNDGAVLRAVHDAFSGLPMPAAPRLEAITARGRARRRRRRRLAGASVAGAGACAALAVGLAASQAGPAPGNYAPAAQLAAFTVTSGSGNTTTLTLRKGMVASPSAVRRALAEHGIPAVVTIGKVCHTAAYPGGNLRNVVTPLGGFPRHAPPSMRRLVPRPADGHLPKNPPAPLGGRDPRPGAPERSQAQHRLRPEPAQPAWHRVHAGQGGCPADLHQFPRPG